VVKINTYQLAKLVPVFLALLLLLDKIIYGWFLSL